MSGSISTSRMDIVRAFEDASLERGFHLNIQGTHDDPLFQANQIGQLLGLSNIRETIKDFDEDEKDAVSSTDSTGRVQNMVFLTDLGLFRLLGLSRKPIARPFQKWVGRVLREIRLHGKFEVSAEHSRILAMKEDEIVLRQEMARHNALVSSNDRVGCIYFARVMTLDGGFVFKMGETDNIRQRMIVLKSEYGECVLLDVFPCIMPHKCEQNLRSTPKFKSNQYTGEVSGKSGTELYVSGPNWPWYKISKSAKNAVEAHMSRSTAQLEMKRLDVEGKRIDLESEKLRVEMERLRIISSFTPEHLEHVISVLNSSNTAMTLTPSNQPGLAQSGNDDEPDEEEEGEDDAVEQNPPPFYAASSTAVRVQGHQIQRYSPDGKTLLATYETLKDAECDPQLSLNRPHGVKINDAVKSHRVYNGFRWAHLPHGEPTSTVQDIGVTVSAPTCRRGKVAILDPTGQIITNVYDSMTAAAKGLNLSVATVSLALTNSTSIGSNKFHVAMFINCTPEMREAHEERLQENGNDNAPPTPLLGNAKSIDMLDTNGALVKTYSSISSAEVGCKIRRRRILNAIESGNAIKDGNGELFKWRYSVI